MDAASDQSSERAQPRLVNLSDAAAYLGVSYWTVRDLVQRGDLPAIRLPHPRSIRGSIRRILIDRNDLDALIDRFRDIH